MYMHQIGSGFAFLLFLPPIMLVLEDGVWSSEILPNLWPPRCHCLSGFADLRTAGDRRGDLRCQTRKVTVLSRRMRMSGNKAGCSLVSL